MFRFRMLIISGALGLLGQAYMTAQSVEIFGGATVSNMKPANNYNSLTTSGWSASITGYPVRRVGLTADFAGYYGTVRPASSSTSQSKFDVRQYSFMAGPQLRLFRKGPLETRFRATFGAAHGYVPGYYSLDKTKFAALFGTNFDFNVSRRVALRFSPGLYLTQFGGETQRNFRFSIGPVFRFGSNEAN